MNNRNSRNIKSEARSGFEGAQAALAQHNVVVAAHGQIFRSRKPLGNTARKAALQQHHLVRLRGNLANILQ